MILFSGFFFFFFLFSRFLNGPITGENAVVILSAILIDGVPFLESPWALLLEVLTKSVESVE